MMAGTPAGMAAQDAAERARFEGELQRVLDAGRAARVALRVVGSLAFHLHCPRYGYLQAALGRAYTDLDFAALSAQARAVRALLAGLGYTENREAYVMSEGGRAMFDGGIAGLHIDVFFDRLDFCHVIPWSEQRLQADAPTLPLAELLLEKMQIVKLNEKDVIDTVMLLLEHELGHTDVETVLLGRVAGLCCADWGLWRTTTMNLHKVRQLGCGYIQLAAPDRELLAVRVEQLLAHLDSAPKSFGWRVRSKLGDRVKWYKDVDEV